MRQRAEERRLVAGEILIEEGAPATHFSLEGEVSVSKMWRATHCCRPLSPGRIFRGSAPIARCPLHPDRARRSGLKAHRFSRGGLWGLLRLCPLDCRRNFRAMAVRLRNLEGSNRQQEKLASLGRMSAGLAHRTKQSAAAQRALFIWENSSRRFKPSLMSFINTEGDHWDRLIGSPMIL